MYLSTRNVFAIAAGLVAALLLPSRLSAQTNFRPCPLPTLSTLIVEDPDVPGHIRKDPEGIHFPVDHLVGHHSAGSAEGHYSTSPSTPETATHRWGLAYIYTICHQPDPWVPVIDVVITNTYGYVAPRSSGGGGDIQPIDHDTWYEWLDGVRFLCTNDYSTGSRITTCVADSY